MKKRKPLFLFGEAEKGPYRAPLLFDNLLDLYELLGEAPAHSSGLPLAIRSILFEYGVIYFRVEEEGFSVDDYQEGLSFLAANHQEISLGAIALPGVGNRLLIEAASNLCPLYKGILLMSEKDLYDFLTDSA